MYSWSEYFFYHCFFFSYIVGNVIQKAAVWEDTSGCFVEKSLSHETASLKLAKKLLCMLKRFLRKQS